MKEKRKQKIQDRKEQRGHLELALSIILKERELYELKHVTIECRCLKI